MVDDWRVYRPAIWLAMLGIALVLVVNPLAIGVIVIGSSIGVWLKIARRRRAAAPLSPASSRAPARRRKRKR